MKALVTTKTVHESPRSSQSGISVLILTLNEEINLPGALESLSGYCDDIVIFDSYSDDATLDIATKWGAQIRQRQFDNYAAQRTAALEGGFKHQWVLMLDADERVPPELWKEMLAAVTREDTSFCMFRMRRKDMFLGRWLRRSSGYPTWFGRLVLPTSVRIEREINEEYIPLGSVGYLQNHLIHFPFNRGISHWVSRHNEYSTLEAAKIYEERKTRLRLEDLVSADPVKRRRALKSIAYRLPMRPTMVFLYLYVFRLGFLDGTAGLLYCRLRASYEMYIDAKRLEASWRHRRDPPCET